jgi:protein SDA1
MADNDNIDKLQNVEKDGGDDDGDDNEEELCESRELTEADNNAAAGGGGSSMSSIGMGGGKSRRVDVTLKLAQLQNLCKRDAVGYREEYLQQKRRLQSEVDILLLQPTKEPSKSCVELIQFCAAVSSASYKGAESDDVARMLLHLLGVSAAGHNISISSNTTTASTSETTSNVPPTTIISNTSSSSSSNMLLLHKHVRKTCVSALILMRNKGALPPLQLLQAFFQIMSVAPEKGLRTQLFKHLVNDVRNLNKTNSSGGNTSGKKHNDQVNRSIQSFLHRIVATSGSTSGGATEDDASVVAAKKATDMVCELYRHGVWTNPRAVAIAAQAVQSPHPTVMARAVRFFLKIEEKMAMDVAEKKEQVAAEHQRIDYHAFAKKTKANSRHVQRQLKRRKKVIHKQQETDEQANLAHVMENDKGVEHGKKLYPAIELLRDPQGLAEHVLKRLRNNNSNSNGNNNSNNNSKSSVKFEVKLLLLNFVTRLVGNHQLQLLPLYPHLQKYLHTHQRNVTEILVYCVQACHEYVPPEDVVGLLKTIAHEFITERCSEEEMAVGINAARAICARVPAVLSMTLNDNDTKSKGDGEDKDNNNDTSTSDYCGMDMQAFCRDLAAFGKHRDRSVAIAGKAWTNFIRETCPIMLQGKHRGMQGTALLRHAKKNANNNNKSGSNKSAAMGLPLRFGESHAAAGVEGADLLAEYEAKKKQAEKRAAAAEAAAEAAADDDEDEDEDEDERKPSAAGDDEDDEEQEDDDVSGEWVEVNDDDEEDDEDEEEENEESEDEEAPQLVNLDKTTASAAATGKDKVGGDEEEEEEVLDLSKMTSEERDLLKQKMSSTRIFTTSDFIKMRKLVERENRAKRDPREAARRKRALARSGTDFEALSDDDDDDNNSDGSDEDEQMHVTGVVNPTDLMAMSKRKRQSKAEKLQKILAGRTKFEAKAREGGSTNVEKKRRKNFVLTKFSQETRAKNAGKGTLSALGKRGRVGKKKQLAHDAKKRRRKV